MFTQREREVFELREHRSRDFIGFIMVRMYAGRLEDMQGVECDYFVSHFHWIVFSFVPFHYICSCHLSI